MAFPRFKTVLAATALVLGLSATASAQIKVGVVNLQKALESTSELKQAEVDLRAKFGPRQDELAQAEKEIAKMQQDYEGNQGKYNQAALAELGQRIQRKQVQLQRSSQALQEDVNRERQDVLQRVGKNLQDVIKKVAEEKGLDLVVDSSAALFAKTGLDISADVTTAYDKAYPAKK
jgi:outer membrane protein